MEKWKAVSAGIPHCFIVVLVNYWHFATIWEYSFSLSGCLATDGTPCQQTSFVFTCCIKSLISFDCMGFPWCCVSFHFNRWFVIKYEIHFFQSSSVDECANIELSSYDWLTHMSVHSSNKGCHLASTAPDALQKILYQQYIQYHLHSSWDEPELLCIWPLTVPFSWRCKRISSTT